MLQTINVAVARQWTTSSTSFRPQDFLAFFRVFRAELDAIEPALEDKDQHITKKKSIPLEFQQGIWRQKTRLVPQHRPHLSWQSAVTTDSFYSISMSVFSTGQVLWTETEICRANTGVNHRTGGQVPLRICSGKGKEEYLYSTFLHQGTLKALRHGSHSFTCK